MVSDGASGMKQSLKTVLVALLLIFGMPNIAAQTCGDGSCDPSENSCNCEDDCGSCRGEVPGKACEIYQCDENLICRPVKIPGCCGNLTCEDDETYGNCPADCLPTSVNVEILMPDQNQSVNRGEEVILKAKLDSEGRSVSGAIVNILNLPTEVKMFNDGEHEDGLIGDNVYGYIYKIPSDLETGIIDLNFSALFQGIGGSNVVTISVTDILETNFIPLDSYALGDIINVQGTVKRIDESATFPLRFSIVHNGEAIGEEIFDMQEDGSFNLQYRTSVHDPVGDWDVILEGNDMLGNRVYVQKNIRVLEARETAFLTINIISEIKGSYTRGENIEVIAMVYDEESAIIKGAGADLITPSGDTIELRELQEGKYSGLFPIPFTLGEGQQFFKITAIKVSETLEQSGSLDFDVTITPAELTINLIDPEGEFFRVGDTLNPIVTVRYPNEEPVPNATVTGLINNQEIEFIPERAGLFKADYVFKEGDEGRVKLSVNARDSYGNSSYIEESFEVAGVSLASFFMQNIWIVVLVIIIIGAVGGFMYRQYIHVSGIDSLLKRKRELGILQKELQKDYYKKASIPKEEYDRLKDEYTSEMSEIEEKIAHAKEAEKKKGK